MVAVASRWATFRGITRRIPMSRDRGAGGRVRRCLIAGDEIAAEIACLSSTMPGRRDDLLAVIDEVRLARPSAAFVVGGRGLTVEDQTRAQVYFCNGVADARDAIDAVVRHAGLN